MDNLLKNWDLQIEASVLKELKKISQRETKKILQIIKLLPTNPYFGDIQKMKGEANVWRRRVGNYRIFYKIFVIEKSILVFHLERRNSKTY